MSSEELLIVHAIIGHGINLSETRGKTVWDTSLKVTNAFLDLASAPLMTLSQPSICGTLGMTTPAHILRYIWQKCPIPRRKTLSPGAVIGLSYLRESTLLRTMCCFTRHYQHHVTGGVW